MTQPIKVKMKDQACQFDSSLLEGTVWRFCFIRFTKFIHEIIDFIFIKHRCTSYV